MSKLEPTFASTTGSVLDHNVNSKGTQGDLPLFDSYPSPLAHSVSGSHPRSSLKLSPLPNSLHVPQSSLLAYSVLGSLPISGLQLSPELNYVLSSKSYLDPTES